MLSSTRQRRKTEIHGVIIKPTSFDPNRRSPVVGQIQAGPHGSFVPKERELQLRQRELVERGFILVMPDAKHGAAETPYGKRRRADFLVRHLLLAP